MTPLQVAKAHCANFQSDGSCLGTHLSDDLKTAKLIKNDRCVLGTKGVRCLYFEECVMPMNRADWPGLKTPKEHQEFGEAIKAYQLASNVVSHKDRKCPDCGRELEPRKRFCYVCSENRKQEANRKRRNGGS